MDVTGRTRTQQRGTGAVTDLAIQLPAWYLAVWIQIGAQKSIGLPRSPSS